MRKSLAEILELASGAKFVKADLHVHSTYSYDIKDASMTPTAVVDVARSLGLAFLSITDHNLTTGSREATEYARTAASDVCVIPGMLDRLMNEGIDRHEAVHAVASVLAEHMSDLARNSPSQSDPNARGARTVDR